MENLELPLILQKLSALALSPEAKERASCLLPSFNLTKVAARIQETTNAKRMLITQGSPPLRSIQNCNTHIARLKLGGTLNNRELLDIATLLSVVRSLKKYGKDGYFEALEGDKTLLQEIENAILGESEIADGASDELYNIRRKMRNTEEKIRTLLQKTLATKAKYLQENLITQRSSRFVVPVRAEHKKDIPGIVHDISSSGATIFIEPTPVVEEGNKLRELQSKEQDEILKILANLSAMCNTEQIASDYELVIAIDLIFAKAKFSQNLSATEPILNQSGLFELKKARHPLLSPEKTVPISLNLGKNFDTLIITGPNTGGKTVALKTLGLLTLMALCGLHITADDNSQISVSRVFSDIGDEQSISQNLSTFSAHMKNIVEILSNIRANDLVLFDELGAGTDPVEGAALAVAIIEDARQKGAKIAATTHYAELKTYALYAAGVENAGCEFDVETLRPTYKLNIGIPGKSNAFEISKRLNLSDEIIENAQQRLSRKDTEFQDVLQNLMQKQKELQTSIDNAEQDRLSAQQAKKDAEILRDRLRTEYDKVKQTADREVRQLVSQAKQKTDEVLQMLRDIQNRKTIKNEEISEIRTKINKINNSAPTQTVENTQPITTVNIGDEIEVRGVRATVSSLPDKNGNVSLKAGVLNLTANISELTAAKPQKKKTKISETVSFSRNASEYGSINELDIHGKTTDEGIMEMEFFIDNAVFNKLHNIRIIHGKGTGVLRSAVHAALKRNKSVKSFRLGRYGEGEDGVTIVELK